MQANSPKTFYHLLVNTLVVSIANSFVWFALTFWIFLQTKSVLVTSIIAGLGRGILGPITDGAIKRMQTYLGTKADGLVGPLTRALINNSCGEAGL